MHRFNLIFKSFTLISSGKCALVWPRDVNGLNLERIFKNLTPNPTIKSEPESDGF